MRKPNIIQRDNEKEFDNQSLKEYFIKNII